MQREEMRTEKKIQNLTQKAEALQLRPPVYLSFQSLALHQMRMQLWRTTESTTETVDADVALQNFPWNFNVVSETPAYYAPTNTKPQPHVTVRAEIQLDELAHSFVTNYGPVLWPDYVAIREHLSPNSLEYKAGKSRGLRWPADIRMTSAIKRNAKKSLQNEPNAIELFRGSRLGMVIREYFEALRDMYPGLAQIDAFCKPVSDVRPLLADVVGNDSLGAVEQMIAQGQYLLDNRLRSAQNSPWKHTAGPTRQSLAGKSYDEDLAWQNFTIRDGRKILQDVEECKNQGAAGSSTVEHIVETDLRARQDEVESADVKRFARQAVTQKDAEDDNGNQGIVDEYNDDDDEGDGGDDGSVLEGAEHEGQVLTLSNCGFRAA